MQLDTFIDDYIKKNHPELTNNKSQTEIRDAIRAGYYFSKGIRDNSNDDDGISKVDYNNLDLLNKILEKANKIYYSKELEWSEKYDMIFCDKISVRVYDLFDWCDPDTTYEEDTTAFMMAFQEYVENKNKLSKY